MPRRFPDSDFSHSFIVLIGSVEKIQKFEEFPVVDVVVGAHKCTLKSLQGGEKVDFLVVQREVSDDDITRLGAKKVG